MSSPASISIDYDFSARKTRIAVRTSDNKLAGRVHIQLILLVEKLFQLFLVQLCHNSRNKYLSYVFFYAFEHILFGVEIVVLGRYDNGINTLWGIVVIVLYGYLTF